MSMINSSIYDVPEIQRSIERIDRRYAKDDNDAQSLWVRVPWEPGQQPVAFTIDSDEAVAGCVEIYNPAEGKIIS